MKSFKTFAILAILMLVLNVSAVFAFSHDRFSGFAGFVPLPGASSTASRDDFRIDVVKVKGLTVSDSAPVRVERGTTVPVVVEFRGTGKIAYDTRIRVYIGGYEYGDVQAMSDIFEVRPGTRDSRELLLRVPYDIEASDDYTLNVEMFDDDNSVRKTYKLRVEEPRNSVNVFDVVFNPDNNVQAGTPLFASVRVENLGDNIENTVKVTLSVSSLNLQTSQLVDRLVNEQDLNEDDSASRRTAATTNDMVLFIPEDTSEGDYEVAVRVDYNRLHNFQEKTYLMHVRALEKAVEPVGPVGLATLSVNVDANAQRVVEGQGAQYKFSVSNMGQDARTLSFEVLGVSDWGASRVDPQSVTVPSNSAKDVNVFVAPAEGFEGAKTFTVRVKEGNNLVAEKTLSVEVGGKVSKGDTLKKVLAIGFVVLLVILVILGIALAIRKLTQEGEEKPVEGQTYY